MHVLFPRVHEATRRLLRRVGYEVREVSGCCGALHAHNGFRSKALAMSERITSTLTTGETLVVNSAGCGSFLKEHSHNVRDLSEFLLENGLAGQLSKSNGVNQMVTYHDACHLSHGQGIRKQPRKLIQAIPELKYVELREADMCCGSGGIYNLTQPTLARQLLDRKWKNITETGAEIVATANPGCHAWIDQTARDEGRKVRVLHTAELLESAFSGLPEYSN